MGSEARSALKPTEGGEGRWHIVAAARLQLVNSFAADFLAPSAGKNIYVTEIKLQSLTFVNTAITVANGTGTVSTTVAIGSERVNTVISLVSVDRF